MNTLKLLKSDARERAVEEEREEQPDIMTCSTCAFRTCARCDRPMHDGEACTAYQARIKDRLEEEDKAL